MKESRRNVENNGGLLISAKLRNLNVDKIGHFLLFTVAHTI